MKKMFILYFDRDSGTIALVLFILNAIMKMWWLGATLQLEKICLRLAILRDCVLLMGMEKLSLNGEGESHLSSEHMTVGNIVILWMKMKLFHSSTNDILYSFMIFGYPEWPPTSMSQCPIACRLLASLLCQITCLSFLLCN